MSGTLYIVPTPVGNLRDMTPRAVEVLSAVGLALAEDTRTTLPLFRHFGIDTRLESHHKFNEHANCQKIIEYIKAGNDVALVSDAGTPGISDPGFMLSRECRKEDIEVVTLPGPTAFVPALINSGLPCDRFVFQGFLPLKKGRMTRLNEIAESEMTNIIYESPVRLAKTLSELQNVCGDDREASVSREISKMFEETRRDTLKNLAKHFAENAPRGEIVIVVGPKTAEAKKVHKNKYKE